MTRFVPDDWVLTDKLRDYARGKGLTEATIDDQEEAFRLCQFPRPILDFDRAWQRWIRNAIEWGKVVPVVQKEYTTRQEITDEQKSADILAFERDMKRYGK
jgi:hypothetical protein